MARMNLLKSGFTKKLGTIYGTKQNGKFIAKAVPFSHAPHSQKQGRALNAFIALNRVSAYIARTFFQYLPLSDREMYKSNAVSKWLTPCLNNNVFDPFGFLNVLQKTSKLVINEVTFLDDSSQFRISITNINESTSQNEEYLLLFIFTKGGNVLCGKVIQGQNIQQLLVPNTTDFDEYFVCVIKSSKINGRRIVRHCDMWNSPAPLVIDTSLVLANKKWQVQPRVEGDTLYLSEKDVIISNNSLHIIDN